MKVLEEAKKRMLKRKLAGEKGSVTLFVLIAMLFFLTIGVVIFITNMNNSSSQQRDVKKIQSQYNNVGDLDEVYEEQKDRQVGKLVISVIDKYKEIYQSTNQNIDAIWIKDDDNKFDLPLSVNITWPEGISNNAKKVEIEGKILTSKGEGNIKHITIQENNISVKDNDGNYRDVMRIIDNLHTLYEDCDITLTATANEGTSSEVSKSVKIRIDRTKPTINMGSGEVENTIWIDLDKDENAKGTIDSGDVSATDEMSGKKSLRYIFTDENRDENNLEELEGDPRWKDVTGKITQTISHDSENEQDYYIYYRAEDNAGNVEYKKSKRYAVRFANYRIETQGKADQYAMTLQDAINKCSDTGSKIVVIQNVNDDSTVVDGIGGINANKNFTLDTNGHTATISDSIVVASGKTVTFVDNKTGENKGKLERVVAAGERGDLITNNGTVIVGVQNEQTGPTLTSKDVVIYHGNVTVYSGNIVSQGKSATSDNSGICSGNIIIYNGNITNDNGNYGIIITSGGRCNISGGTVSGKYAICPTNGTLTISGSAKINGRTYGVNSAASSHKYTLNMTGGSITSQTGIAIYSQTDTNVTITGGTITGGNTAINITGANSKVTIGDKTQNLSTEAPKIKAINGYGINIEDATSSLEFYSGQIIGTQTSKVKGVDVSYSIADASKVTYRTGYGAHTTEESGVYTTTLVEPEFNVNMQNIYLNLTDKTTEEIKVTGRDLGTITYTSQDETKATVTAKDGDNKTGVVTAKAEGTTKVIVKDTNSGLEKEITVYVDNTPPQITKIEPNTTTLWEETEGKVQRQEVTVTIEATDNISGVKTIQYIVDQNAADPAANAEWQTYNDTDKIKINNSKAGEYYIHIKVTDKSGNVTIGKSEKYIVKDVNYTIEKDGNTQLAQTLAEAVNNAQTGSTIKPLKDYTDNSTATINKDVTIDTNGKTLTMANTITVASGKTVTFVDTAETKGKLQRTTGDLITNNGTVIVNGGILESKNIVINGETVNVLSGTVNNTGVVSGNSNDARAIYGRNVTVSGGTVSCSASHSIVSIASTTVTGGTITSKSGIAPLSGTLNISGNNESPTITGTDYGIWYGISQSPTINISGGRITGGSYAILGGNTRNKNANIEITGGELTGGVNAIYVAGEKNIVKIGNSTTDLNKTSPEIKGEQYSVQVTGSGSTLNYYDGKLIGKKHDKTYDGREVTFNVAEANVTPRTGYKPYTRQNGDYYETVLEKEITVTADAGDGTISATNGWTLAQDGKTATKKVLQNTPYGTLPTKDEMERTGYTFKGWNGKNLLAKPMVAVTATETRNMQIDNMFYIKAGTYTVSRTITNAETWREAIILKNANGEALSDSKYNPRNPFTYYNSSCGVWLGGTDYASSKESNISYTITVVEDCYIKFVIMFGDSSLATISNAQLEEGTTATAYEPYQEIKSDTPVTSDTDHKIYAKWEANDYKVKFDGDGATSGTMADQSFKYDEEKALTQNAYTRAYTVTYNGEQGTPAKENDTATYQFKNWKNKTNNQEYEDKQKVKNLTSEPNGEVTLYAVWNPQSVTLPTATREGYIFNGWYDAATDGNKIGDAGDKYIPEANTTLHAGWRQVHYTITVGTENLVAETMQEAIKLAEDRITGSVTTATITATESYTDNSTANITKNITINIPDGKTITMANTITVANGKTVTFTGTGTLQRTVEDGVRGDLIRNNGTVIVGVENAENGPTLTSKDVVILGGTVTVYSGNIASQGKFATTDSAGIYSKSINVYGGNITNDSGGYYGIVIIIDGICNVTGGKVSGRTAICPQNGTLNIGGDAKINGRVNAIGSAAPTHSYKLKVTGGEITGESNNAINATADNTNITITGGTITGAIYGISMTGANSTLTIDDNTAGVNQTSPKIQGTNVYSVNIAGTGSTFNYNDGLLVGKNHDKTYDGRDVTFSAADGVTVTPLTGYKPYTRKNGDLYETVLEKEVTVTADANNGTISATNGWAVAQDNKTATKTVLQNTTYGALPSQDKMTKTGYTFQEWHGKNLFDYDHTGLFPGNGGSGTQQEINGEKVLVRNPSYNNNSIWPIYNGRFINFENGKTYTISFDIWADTELNISSRFYINNATETTLNGITKIQTTRQKAYGTFTYKNSEGAYIHIYPLNVPSDCKVYIANFQVEEGTTATVYEPYQVIESSTPVTSDTDHKIYANWTANTYQVTFDPNGGSVIPTFKPVTYDSTYGTLPTPTRDGYTFDGWYKENTFQNKVEANTIVKTADNHTLIAKWTANTYKIKFNANGGTGTMSDLDMTYDTAKNLTSNAFTKTGYSFVKWTTKADGTGDEYTNNQSVNNLTTENGAIVNLYAQWEANPYTVTFNPKGGTVNPTNKTVIYDSAYGELPSGENITRTGYTFDGWYKEEEYTNKVEATTIVNTASNHTLFAKWTANNYTIHFNANGGTGEMADEAMTYDVEKALTKNTFTKTGYTFTGWSQSNEGFENRLLYSNDTEKTNTSGSYHEEFLQYADFAPYFDKYGINAKYRLEYDIKSEDISNANYMTVYFQNGSNTRYGFKANTDPNNRVYSGGVHQLYVSATEWTHDTLEFKVVESNLSQTKAMLAFWGQYDTGNKPRVKNVRLYIVPNYTDEQVVKNLTSEVNGEVTLYANWEANPYEVTADAMGGTIPTTDGWTNGEENKTARKQVTYDSAYGTLPAPTRTGYTFKEWHGKNMLKLDVSQSTPSSTAYANTTKRVFTNGTYVKGLAFNNYYQPSNVGNYTIESNSLTITASNGYGIGYPMLCTPGKTYTVSCNATINTNNSSYAKTVVGIQFYKVDGTQIAQEYVTTDGNAKVTKVAPSDAYYIVVTLGANGTNNNITYTNIQLEEGTTSTEFEPYTIIDADTIVKTAGDHKIYANWTVIPYTISYELNGGTVSPANPTTYNIETSTFTLNNPTKDGYVFIGWTGSNGETRQTTVTVEKGSYGNKTYTANWGKLTLSKDTIFVNASGAETIAKEGTTAASTAQVTYTVEGTVITRLELQPLNQAISLVVHLSTEAVNPNTTSTRLVQFSNIRIPRLLIPGLSSPSGIWKVAFVKFVQPANALPSTVVILLGINIDVNPLSLNVLS